MSAAPHEYARAKVNLFLHVTGRRSDGYHLLDSLAVFPDVGDRLSVVPDARLRLSLCGPFASSLRTPRLDTDSDDNLVLRAARALARHRRAADASGAHLTLEKHLPVASGIGGGSADAAAALRLLLRSWSYAEHRPPDLHALAAELGADVAVCLAQRPARMRGVGDRLGAAPDLPELGMVLVNCGEAVATREVFQAREPGFSPEAVLPQGWPDAAALADSLAGLSNDLEAAARRICPAIDVVLATLRDLPGCRLARMSGSGATCFGVFDSPEAARAAVADARQADALPVHWWVWSGGLFRSR